MNSNLQLLRDPHTGLVVDVHRSAPIADASEALRRMAELESGAVSNADEERMVGHYWLRAPDRAPLPAITDGIKRAIDGIRSFKPPPFTTILQVGLGGSALGPELIHDALKPSDGPRFVLLDTVDPSAVASMLDGIDPSATLVVVASKSGTTAETLTAMRFVQNRFRDAGVNFADRAVAVTIPDSPLAIAATDWCAVFPIFEWVGGRTSVFSAVGLLPMHLMGIDIDAFLGGAAAMDNWTRSPAPNNPAVHLASAWAEEETHSLCVIPYTNRLRVLTRYLQQLIMESLGKAKNRDGRVVHQGLTVFGNKGSADQHAIVQQLRDGPSGVSVNFIDVHGEVEPELLEASDLQFALHSGTAQALFEAGRSVTNISLRTVDPGSLGALIALYERAVGLTAEMMNINAYHQPGVEAGKTAARSELGRLARLQNRLSPEPKTAQALAEGLDLPPERVWRLAHHLAHTRRAIHTPGKSPSEDLFQAVENSSK